MGSVQKRHRRLPAAAAALAALSSILVLGCSTQGSDPAGPDVSNLGPANVPLPPGEWAATGIVQKGTPLSNQPPGTVLKRPWTFKKTCIPSCRRMFLRWTLYGPSVTRLVAHGGFFTAKFPPVEVPCTYPRGSSYTRHRFGQSHDSYRLRWSADGRRINAVEYRLETGCYPTPDPPDVTRWTAVRASRPPAPPGDRS